MQDDASNPNLYTIDIGNILPGQRAVVTIKLIQPMDIKGNAFHFNLPLTYFPRNNNQGAGSKNTAVNTG
jgi:hypothetical protein